MGWPNVTQVGLGWPVGWPDTQQSPDPCNRDPHAGAQFWLSSIVIIAEAQVVALRSSLINMTA